MKNILITGVGGPTPRSIARTIRKVHPSYKLIGTDSNPRALGFFMPDLIHVSFVIPRIDISGYWSIIHRIIESERIDLAFVQPESEVIGWGNYFKEFGFFPCPVFIPPVELASAMMDKSILAEILKNTEFIPRTLKITQLNPLFNEVVTEIGFPCWIRAAKGSGGLASLKIINLENYKGWLFINSNIDEFTISEFLPGRHLATQMLYYRGKYMRGAALECVEYVMASIAPSKITGNTSFGRFLNEDRILEFCDRCITYICTKLKQEAHGVFSFDLKEDADGNLKVTEINIRHMAYTGVMADVGFDLIGDTIALLNGRDPGEIKQDPYYKFDKPYVFLRDVDTEPVILQSEELLFKIDTNANSGLKNK